MYMYFAEMSECSSAWLERFVRDEEAEGSNPFTPTIFLLNPQTTWSDYD